MIKKGLPPQVKLIINIKATGQLQEDLLQKEILRVILKNNEEEKISREAKEAIFSDPNIKAIEDEFNAIIDSDTIKPI